MTSSQLSVEQGEGKPPAIFEVYLDLTSSKKFKEMIFERIRKFSVAIKKQYGYDVVLQRTHEDVLGDDSLDGLDTVMVYIPKAHTRYEFYVTDHTVEYTITKRV